MKIDSSEIRAMLGGVMEGFEEHEKQGVNLTLELVAHSLPSMFLQTCYWPGLSQADEAVIREHITQHLLAGAERLNRQGEPKVLN